jgi:hypothetical protein
MAAMRSGINRLFPVQLPGPFAFYDGESMTYDAEEDITAWANRLGDATYDLTIPADPNQPVSEVVESFNGRRCATFTGGQRASSTTLDDLLAGNSAFTMYFACQFERDETSASPSTAYLLRTVHDGSNVSTFYIERNGTGPYTYTLTCERTAAGTAATTIQVANLTGSELSSDKFYVCIVGSGATATAYVNTIATTGDSGDWLDDSLLVTTVYVGNRDNGQRPFHGPIGGIYLYDQAHSVTQIQSMIENWMPSYFGPIGDTIQALSPTYYAKAEEAILSGTDITELPNLASLWEGWGFHGTADTAAMAHDTATSIPMPDGDWSIGGWMKNDELAQSLNWIYQQGVNEADSSVNIFYYGSGHGSDGKVKCTVVDAESNSSDVLTATAAYGVSSWQHVLVTYDKSEGKLKIYMNGALAGTETGVVLEGLSTNTAQFGDSANTIADYDGTLRQWAKWDSLLNIDQITLLAAGTTPDNIGTPAWHIPMTVNTAAGGTIDGLTLTNTGVTGVSSPA